MAPPTLVCFLIAALGASAEPSSQNSVSTYLAAFAVPPRARTPCDDDDLPSGLRAVYRSKANGAEAVRIDSDIQFQWSDASPDPRVAADQFEVRWLGKLFVAAKAQYRFHLFVAGSARLRIDGSEVMEGTAKDAAWLSSAELTLDLGHHAIELIYAKTSKEARIGLYWESTKFGLEPVGPRWLFHDRSAENEPGDFERGGELVRAYRCAACHHIPGVDLERKAPALDHAADRMEPDWLARWLEDTHRVRSDARMPDIGLNAEQSRAVAAFLLSATKKAAVNTKNAATTGRADVGEALFRSLGCMACHMLNGSGNAGLFGGGALDGIAQKRPATFFRDWLTKPESINSAHRMPTFLLKKDEVEDLASFLATLGQSPSASDSASSRSAPEDQLKQGKRLVVEHRCAACHDIPTIHKPAEVPLALHKGAKKQQRIDSSQSCLDRPDTARHRPGYRLNDSDRRAIEAFMEQLPAQVAPQSQYELGRRLLRELNCAACHARDLDHGPQPSSLGSDDRKGGETELAKLRGELEPPSLTSVGDKFHNETLVKLIQGGITPRRPWLKVRMPRFTHTDAERDALLSFLVEHDRIRNRVSGQKEPTAKQRTGDGDESSRATELDAATALAAGHQLISSRGFGCMSCHTVGKHQPKGVAVNARGSDLIKIGDRLRHEWFLRWVRDPARIVPGMEMPAITVPVRGVVDDRLDLQVESLWQALNSPSFVVPSDRDTAQQIISLEPRDEPVILRDVMYDCPPGSGWCPRAFAIGLPNRQNILIDLDTGSLRGWWFGDFARERTEGKTWLWEPAGLPIRTQDNGLPPFALKNSQTGEFSLPTADGQFVIRLDGWSTGRSHDIRKPCVLLHYRLRFHEGAELRVSETIHALSLPGRTGFLRDVSVSGVPENYLPVLLFSAQKFSAETEEFTDDSPLGDVTLGRWRNEESKWYEIPQLKPAGKGLCFGLECHPLTVQQPQHGFCGKLVYWGPLADRLKLPAPTVEVAKPTRAIAASLPVAPGFEVVRLPLDRSVMPTAIAVKSDGILVVCSLKGEVLFARDSDNDGLADSWQAITDHLAAPFGILAERSGLANGRERIFVGHKPEVLELGYIASQPYPSISHVVGTGWGYTKDYHDWTFGPVQDSKGNLYIGTGSDYTDKDRPKDARKWRGRILKISGLNDKNKIEELARGARYPTGLAVNRDDQVFFTDNQGVQNTFNEINHVIPGSRYGVSALDDPPPDQDPWPERSPAIQIPHPWTRSINGICFLDSGGKWGPFEGHGIGCEYDTRGLIRFSLQKIGDTYQGACYPFTLPEEQVPQEERLLGPICCAVSPTGDLYVGGLRDSGWGGGNNVGELVRIRPSDHVPLGVREVRAWRQGFVIDFTAPIDAEAAMDADRYTISSYHRIWKGTYATPDSDRRTEKIRTVQVTEDRRSVVITLESMRPGFVYELHLSDMGQDGGALWPADAYYTLNSVPDIAPVSLQKE